MAWTLFWDMYSGGGCKEEPYDKIYIEAPEADARCVFWNRFEHNPERVTCTCCGDDYSIGEEPTLEQISAFHRNCQWFGPPDMPERNADGRYFEDGEAVPDGWTSSGLNPFRDYETMEQYLKRETVLVIRADEITLEQRVAEIPDQGYVWAGDS